MLLKSAPSETAVIIRRALSDAIDYRRNHTRQSERLPSRLMAAEYENVAAELEKRRYAIVRGGTVARLNLMGDALIPAADVADVLEALFLASAVRMADGSVIDAARFRELARKLGDSR